MLSRVAHHGFRTDNRIQCIADPGHYSTFVISPPDYAAVLDVGGENANKVPAACTPATCVGRWTVNNLVPVDGREEQTVSLTMGHRNTSTTSVVELDPSKEAVSLHLKVDLFDEQAVQIDFIAGISYLDSTTMENWGISLVELSSLATIPQITSDGIRLAYENGIAPLDDFTDQFPVASIGNAFSDSIPGGPNIEMGELSWVSDSVAEGIEGPAGGLKLQPLCGVLGNRRSTKHNIVLHRRTKRDGICAPDLFEIDEQHLFTWTARYHPRQSSREPVFEFEDITNEDLRRVMDAGLSLETVLDTSFYKSMIPRIFLHQKSL